MPTQNDVVGSDLSLSPEIIFILLQRLDGYSEFLSTQASAYYETESWNDSEP